MKTSTAVFIALGVVAVAPVAVHNQAAIQAARPAAARPATSSATSSATNRHITIQTSEVTSTSLDVTPDGQALIFGALGHLFRVPVAGGQTTQLTTGAWYDSDPSISPDGRRVAFTSNRDGSSSNVFVLDLASKKVTQISFDIESGRATWSPDGKTIAYARNIPHEDHPMDLIPGFADTGLREIRTVPAAGGRATIVGKPMTVEALFYLPDGRLAWSATEKAAGGGMFQTIRQTRIETQGAGGAPTVLGTVPGNAGRVVPGPKGDGVYYAARGGIEWLAFGGNPTPTGAKLVDGDTRLALSNDGSAIYYGDGGGLWKEALPSGQPQRIPFTATIAMELRPITPYAKYQAPPATTAPASLRAVMAPQVSPDGKQVVFMAGGFLWEQPVSGGTAHRLFDTPAFERDPVFSPDGTKLAYVAGEDGTRTLRVYDFGTKQTRTLFTTGGAAWPLFPKWSPDGQRIIFEHARNLGQPFPIVIVNVADGATQEATQTIGSWIATPQFAADGRSIYFTNRAEKIAAMYRLALSPGAKPEKLTDLRRHVHEAQVSPDGKWVAFRRNSEIWMAPMETTPIRDAQVKRVSLAGGRAFSFTPDAKALVYTAGGKVYRLPIAGGARAEIPVRATLPRAVAAPLLISRVRVLNLDSGAFGVETSMFVEGGRIRWIGSEQGHQLPSDVVRLDGGGRFVIPGLWDMHVHSAWANNQTSPDAFIAYGVTSVRDTGSRLDLLTALDDRSTITGLPTPRYVYSGEIFEGAMPLWGDAFLQIWTKPEARAEVRDWKAWGADYIKMYPSLPWYLQQTVADEAHRVGLPLVGHGLSTEESIRRVVLGFNTLEHGTSVTGGYDDVLQMLAKSGTRVDLTLSVGGANLMRAEQPAWDSDWRVQEYVPEASRAPRGGGGRGGGANQTVEQLQAQAKVRYDRVMDAERTGVKMLAGTDSLMGGVYFGLATHWEITQFVEAGYTPIQALRMATQQAADVVNAGADLGSLTPGKLADLILLDKNPLEDIHNTQSIWQVVKGGRVYDPKTMRK